MSHSHAGMFSLDSKNSAQNMNALIDSLDSTIIKLYDKIQGQDYDKAWKQHFEILLRRFSPDDPYNFKSLLSSIDEQLQIQQEKYNNYYIATPFILGLGLAAYSERDKDQYAALGAFGMFGLAVYGVIAKPITYFFDIKPLKAMKVMIEKASDKNKELAGLLNEENYAGFVAKRKEVSDSFDKEKNFENEKELKSSSTNVVGWSTTTGLMVGNLSKS